MYKSTNYILAIGLLALTACGNTGVNTTPNTSSTSPSANSSSGITQGNTSVTLAKYNQITTDMNYSQVVAILGEPAVKKVYNNPGLPTLTTYQWREPGKINSIIVTFRGDKMASKNQTGLE